MSSTKAEKKNAAGVTRQKGNLMYLGPTIVGVVRHSVVFKDGVFPGKVKDCIKELPMMEKLFVEVDKIPEAIKELNKQQSTLGTIYAQVKKKFK